MSGVHAANLDILIFHICKEYLFKSRHTVIYQIELKWRMSDNDNANDNEIYSYPGSYEIYMLYLERYQLVYSHVHIIMTMHTYIWVIWIYLDIFNQCMLSLKMYEDAFNKCTQIN